MAGQVRVHKVARKASGVYVWLWQYRIRLCLSCCMCVVGECACSWVSSAGWGGGWRGVARDVVGAHMNHLAACQQQRMGA